MGQTYLSSHFFWTITIRKKINRKRPKNCLHSGGKEWWGGDCHLSLQALLYYLMCYYEMYCLDKYINACSDVNLSSLKMWFKWFRCMLLSLSSFLMSLMGPGERSGYTEEGSLLYSPDDQESHLFPNHQLQEIPISAPNIITSLNFVWDQNSCSFVPPLAMKHES